MPKQEPKDEPDTGRDDDDAGTKGSQDDEDKKAGDASQLGEGGKRALDAIRKERDDYQKQLRDVQTELKKIQDKDLSDSERAQRERDELKTERDKLKQDLLRLTVAGEKGLTPKQAVRLVGDTKEDLEADADELLAEFGGVSGSSDSDSGDDDSGSSSKSGPPSSRPKEKLKGGGQPDVEPEETDPAKLAELHPRI